MADNKQYRIHIKHGDFELDLEGDRAFVESYVEALLADTVGQDMAAAPAAPKQKKVRAAKSAPGRKPKAQRKTFEADKAKLAAFMKGRKAKSGKDRYLEYMRFLKAEGVPQVDDAMIQACFVAQGLEVPKTGRQYFSSLRTLGLVTNGSKRGLWKLTKEGEAEAPAKPAKRTARKPGRPKTAAKRKGRKAGAAKPKAPKGKTAKKAPAVKAPAAKAAKKRKAPKARAAGKSGRAKKTAAKAEKVAAAPVPEPEAKPPQQ